jgi:hypothetical protein
MSELFKWKFRKWTQISYNIKLRIPKGMEIRKQEMKNEREKQ